MIRLGRRSGYEIKQTVELSIRFFWTVSQAQIYPALEQLERRRLIDGRDDPQGRRPRRIYGLKPSGEAALAAWLVNDDPLGFELRDVGLLKLFFADLLERSAALDLLARIERRSLDRLAQLDAIAPSAASMRDDEGHRFPLITLRLGVAFHRALADECAVIRRELSD
ncbi:MAG TPA: PadR family transcriptional regulator [Solirubrobacteraceae bacterium]